MAGKKALAIYSGHRKQLLATDYLVDAITVYVDDVLTKSVARRWYNLSIAGGAGECSKFLTSDGLTKAAGNTFLFASVICGSGAEKALQGVTENAIFSGFEYNVTTGLARWVFEESKNTGVLIGGNVEGLEFEENGTAVAVWVEGVSN